MTTEVSFIISGLVFAMTQLIKWQGLPDRFAPISVWVLSILATLLWAIDNNELRSGNYFSLVSGATAIALQAAGIFGFGKAGAELVTRLKPDAIEPESDAQKRSEPPELYGVLHEYCLRTAFTTTEPPVDGKLMDSEAIPATCRHCRKALTVVVCKRDSWIADDES